MSESSVITQLKKRIMEAVAAGAFAEMNLENSLTEFAKAVREPVEKRVEVLEKELKKSNQVVNDLHRELKRKGIVT